MQIETIKEKFFDILIIGLALIIANNIYKAQGKVIVSLKERKQIELKRLDVLKDVNRSYERINSIKSFVNNKDISLIVNSLTDIAKDCHIQIDSLKPGKDEEASGYVIYPFELSVSAGSYHNLGKFISRLESSADFYIIRSLDFSFIADSAIDKNSLKVNLAIATVLIKD
ncbi:MAG: type 4a pilus biogenesis protein PilO [Candidatus Omnitrophota bacterium]|nr:type 4a pilus biogenesis protein PilO [Candidatus Omnitrophota bacterium]MBU1929580.1 type 4a pilus biogenesis protein PilO [Candidatus Omnitrophota bacterium]MBU2034986.1 type 4a pilus biogenesis protein PilO [Candidatus Omnitrophota bacterium]MBU2258587.1 type 4a pilus biogenesis protein PilO [Candidatus Omnitrophota bacterium]